MKFYTNFFQSKYHLALKSLFRALALCVCSHLHNTTKNMPECREIRVTENPYSRSNQRRCPFAKFLRTPILKNICKRLLLVLLHILCNETFATSRAISYSLHLTCVNNISFFSLKIKFH